MNNKKLSKKVSRKIVHVFVKPRKHYYKKVSEYAQGVKGKKILELGSGPLVKGKYFYSAKHLFDKSNDFRQTDIVADFGHPIVDVTKIKMANEYDIIMCLNVLEHVYEFQKAINNMHKALKSKGSLIIVVPAFYPLHDEPHDYWRFTEHALRRMLKDFSSVAIEHKGVREFPTGYYIIAKK